MIILLICGIIGIGAAFIMLAFAVDMGYEAILALGITAFMMFVVSALVSRIGS